MWRSRLTVWLSRQPATRTFASATLDGVLSGRLYLDVKIFDINEDFQFVTWMDFYIFEDYFEFAYKWYLISPTGT